MSISSTVAGLSHSGDGSIGIIRVGSGATLRDEFLIWHEGQQAWIGRPRFSLKQIDSVAITQAGDTSIWMYAGGAPFVSDADSKKLAAGFHIHQILDAKALWDAGLRLQENLNVIVKCNGQANMQIALNSFSLETSDGFLSPTTDNIGTILNVPAWNDTTSPFRFATTGWQNSPITAPTKANIYPNLYLKGAAGFYIQDLNVKYRWVAGTLGGLGGSDDSTNVPPIWDKIFSWHVADDIPQANGTTVANWTDLTGYNSLGLQRHLLQATGSKQPILQKAQVNGHAVVRFDGVDDVLHTLNGSVTQPLTVFIVMKQYSAGGTQQVWVSGGTSSAPLFYRDTGTDKVDTWGGSGGDLTYNRGTAWPSSFICFNTVFNGASSSIWENKTSKITGTASGGGMAGLSIGAAFNDTLPATIDVAEVIIYYSALNDTDRNSVIDWLNTKYNLF